MQPEALSYESPRSESAVPSKRALDGVNLSSMVLVLICFFLPLAKLTCAEMITFNFTGYHMAMGSMPEPQISDPSMQASNAISPTQKSEVPKEPLVLAMPILAAVGAILAALALRTQPARSWALAAVPALLVALLAFFAVAGFSIEREIKTSMAKSLSQGGSSTLQLSGDQNMDLGPRQFANLMKVSKTPWFWLALIASAVALVVAIVRNADVREDCEVYEDPAPPPIQRQQA